MRHAAFLAAVWLAIAPAVAPAASETPAAQKPVPGPTAGRALNNSTIPAAPVVIGGLVLVGALLVVALGSTDSNNNTNGASTGTNP